MSNKYQVNEAVLKEGEYIDPCSGVLRSKGATTTRTKEEMAELYQLIEEQAPVIDKDVVRRTVTVEGVVIAEYPLRPKGTQWSVLDAKVAKKMELEGCWSLGVLEHAIKNKVKENGITGAASKK